MTFVKYMFVLVGITLFLTTECSRVPEREDPHKKMRLPLPARDTSERVDHGTPSKKTPGSKLTEWISEVWKRASGIAAEHSFQKYCHGIDSTDNNITWKTTGINDQVVNYSKQSDSEREYVLGLSYSVYFSSVFFFFLDT